MLFNTDKIFKLEREIRDLRRSIRDLNESNDRLKRQILDLEIKDEAEELFKKQAELVEQIKTDKVDITDIRELLESMDEARRDCEQTRKLNNAFARNLDSIARHRGPLDIRFDKGKTKIYKVMLEKGVK